MEKKQCLFLKQHQALWFGVNSNVGEIVFLFCLFCPNCVHIYIFALKMILTKLDHSVVYVITSAWWFLWQCFRKMDRLLFYLGDGVQWSWSVHEVIAPQCACILCYADVLSSPPYLPRLHQHVCSVSISFIFQSAIPFPKKVGRAK